MFKRTSIYANECINKTHSDRFKQIDDNFRLKRGIISENGVKYFDEDSCIWQTQNSKLYYIIFYLTQNFWLSNLVILDLDKTY